MSKYQFHRFSGDTFQQMAQALLEQALRARGQLTQFTSYGADGSREAVWIQPVSHPDYSRPVTETADVPKHWVFQVKYHDIGLRGWGGSVGALLADLKAEVEKIVSKHGVPCHHYVMITNVPLSGGRHVGGRDRISRLASELEAKIPRIEVWDAADLSRMLDANAGVRAAYAELILPGDLLAALFREVRFSEDRRTAALRGYLHRIVTHEASARAEEANDEGNLLLSKVFVDQTLRLDRSCVPEAYTETVDSWLGGGDFDESVVPEDLDLTPTGFALLWGELHRVMLLAGPGYGKSTITQFLALYHAARVVDAALATTLASRLRLPSGWTAAHVDSACTVRIPFRLELRRYAKWRREQQTAGIGAYIASQVIGAGVESSLGPDDVFAVVSENPSLVILDGLDEVPNREDRNAIMADCDAFLNRCRGEGADLQLVMSSRPQGYHGEFAKFQPIQWVINDLSIADFTNYCADWLAQRMAAAGERLEAEERIRRGLSSDAVRKLATTLLQATVMLTIVKRKSDIPEERHKLFHKYVDVVFQREAGKNELVAQYEPELRLLHEMVGYSIHESVARGLDGLLPGARFKELIAAAWRTLRGDAVFSGVLNVELQRICDLATDRLVFLTGKGAAQADVDFVIQQYREYFAASYLINNTEANLEKVLKALLERGAYWQQVLRFYVAFVPPADQAVWAYEAMVGLKPATNASDIVAGIAFRRAVLLSLPEFVRFSLEQFERVLAGIMPSDEWWSWVDEEWAMSILREVRRGTAWRLMWQRFRAMSAPPRECVEFALALFPYACPREAPERGDVLEFVRGAIRGGSLARTAIRAAVRTGAADCLAEASEADLVASLNDAKLREMHRDSALRASVIQRLSRREALRHFCTATPYYFEEQEANAWAVLGFKVSREDVIRVDLEERGNVSMFVSVPRWSLLPKVSPLPEGVATDADDVGPYGGYLLKLRDVFAAPRQAHLYAELSQLEQALPVRLIWTLQSSNAAGPNPSSFASEKDWQDYRDGVVRFIADDKSTDDLWNVIRTFDSSGEGAGPDWICLLFPPQSWDALVEVGLLTPERARELGRQAWAKLAALRGHTSELVSLVHNFATAGERRKIPFVPIMQVAIRLAKDGKLCHLPLAAHLLTWEPIEAVAPEDLSELVRRLEEGVSLPMTWWRAFFEVAARHDGAVASELASLWERLPAAVREGVRRGLGSSRPWDPSLSVIEGLARLGGLPAFDLACVLAAERSSLPSDLARELNRGAIAYLRETVRISAFAPDLLRCLLATPPTRAEAAFWGDVTNVVRIVGAFPWLVRRLSERIGTLPQSIERTDISVWRGAFSALLEARASVPRILASAALNSLMQLEVIDRSALTDADWRAE